MLYSPDGGVEPYEEADVLIDWTPGVAEITPCPVCGADGDKPRRLVAHDRQDGGQAYPLHLCPACGCHFFHPMPAPHYEAPRDADGAVKFYVEQGAGIDVMLEPTAVLDAVPVKRYLEIGCGFGFSLDFASRSRGWECRGYDPGLPAGQGRAALGLDIRAEYFSPDTDLDAGAWDAILCSEVVEHVTDPGSFLRMLGRGLTEKGVLVLTTPNADGITPDTPYGALVPLLSAGFHTLLFNAAGLGRLLAEAGFTHVRMEETPYQIRAVAARVPLPDPLPAFDRSRYRAYLEGRCGQHPANTPLGAGYRHRLLKEWSNAGDYGRARPILADLRAAFLEVYGFDIDDPAGIPFPPPGTVPFDTLANRYPFNLTGVMYARAMIQMNADGDWTGAVRSLEAARTYAVLLRTALQSIGTDDGETEDVGNRALGDRLCALARVDAGEALTELARLRAAAGGGLADPVPAALLEQARRRMTVILVNAGRYDDALTLVERKDWDDGSRDMAAAADDAALGDGLSLLFVLGILALNHLVDYPAAAAVFGRLYEACRAAPSHGVARDLLWHARYHQGLALRYQDDAVGAAAAAHDLLAPSAAGWPPVPPAYRAWAEQNRVS